MNERIRELAVQARQEFLKMPTGYTPEQVGMYPQLMEKFAELIIKQCGVALHPMLRDMVSRGQAYELIKEHFGVEE